MTYPLRVTLSAIALLSIFPPARAQDFPKPTQDFLKPPHDFVMRPEPSSIATVAAAVVKEYDTKDQVLKKAGTPTTIVPATTERGETWIYHASPMTVTVEFDSWGVKNVRWWII